MDDPLTSKWPRTLLFARIASFAVLTFEVIYFLVTNADAFFLYLTLWGVTFTWAMFGLILLHYQVPKFSKLLSLAIPSLWIVNAFITLYYWTMLSATLSDDDVLYLIMNILDHSVPLIANSMEVFMDNTRVSKIHTLSAMAFLLVYLLCVNMPYTLAEEEIYRGITYTNAFTYIILVVAMLLAAGLGTALYYIKKKKIMDDQEKPNNIEPTIHT